MTDVSAVTDAIVTRVKTITALANRASAFGKDFVDPPWAIVVPSSDNFWRETSFGGGSYDGTWIIKLLIGAGSDRSGQDQLSDYLDTTGAKSIKAAVDGTLGSVVSFATVVTAQNIGDVEHAGMLFYGAEFVVEVGM